MALMPMPTPTPTDRNTDALFGAAQQTLQHNLARLLAVATETDDGEARSLSKTDLAVAAGMGRSTLHKLLKPSAEGHSANPDLQTLCRLAAALNVPLPYLLMNADEWRRLVNAIPTLLTALQDEGAQNLMAEGVRQTQPRKRSKSSLALAKRLNVYDPGRRSKAADPSSPDAAAPRWESRFADLDQQRRRAIRTLSALPDYAHMDGPSAQTAFSLCVLLGGVTALTGVNA